MTVSDPMPEAARDVMIALIAATAQAQAEATKEAQKAGIVAAKAKEDKFRGRKPRYCREQLAQVLDMIGNGKGASEISKITGLDRMTITRICEDVPGAEAAMKRREV